MLRQQLRQPLTNMSKQFQQLAVFTLAEMREWRGAISAVVTCRSTRGRHVA